MLNAERLTLVPDWLPLRQVLSVLLFQILHVYSYAVFALPFQR